MSNGDHKEQVAKFARQVKLLGGERAIAEWTEQSGLVGYEYERRIYRWRVPGSNNREAMLDRMITACHAALLELRCLKEGIVRINGGKTQGAARQRDD